MRHRAIIAILIGAFALCIGMLVFLRPPAPAGNFLRGFSDAEKRQIVSAANSDAIRQVLMAIRRGRFGEAKRWIMNSRKQTVRSIGKQGKDKIHVSFAVDDPAETDGYFIWARYIMKKEKGRWVIDQPLF